MNKFLIVISISLLSACGKTPIKVQNEKISSQNLAKRYAERVTKSPDSEKAIAISNLGEFDASEMDWELFWRMIGESVTRPLSQGEIESLAQSDCRAGAYDALLSYVVAKNFAIAPFLIKQYCDFPANNRLLESVLEKLNTENSIDVTRALAPTLSNLLVKFPGADFGLFESKISGESWAKVFSDVFLRPANLRELLIVLNEAKIGKIPYSAAIIDAKYREHFKHQIPLRDSLLSWTYLFTLSSAVPVPLATPSESDFFWKNYFSAWAEVWKKDATSDGCSESCLETSLEVVALTRKLLPRFENLSFRWQLMWNEQLQRSFQKTLSAKPDLALKVLFQSKGIDSAWFLLRINPSYSRNPEIRRQISTPWATSDVSTPLEQAVRYRVLAHAASDATQRLALIGKLCEIFSANGAPESELDLATPPVMLPGCYRIVNAGADTEFGISSVQLPFDSVLKTYGKNLVIKTERLDGSFVDGSAYDRPAALSHESPPAGASALALPLIIGLRIDGPQADSPDDIVFFPVHTVIRQAQGNLQAQQKPVAGIRGGNVTFKIKAESEGFMPSFVSFGSDGQPGAPTVPGGYADESYLSTSRIEREIVDWTGPQGEAINFEPKLSHQKLHDLWIKGKQTGGLPLLQYSVEHTLKSLQKVQREKLLAYCAAEGYGADRLDTCFVDFLVPKAEAQIRALMDSYQSLSREDAQQVPAILNGEKVFSLPAGSPGGVNPAGPVGERGTYSIEFL